MVTYASDTGGGRDFDPVPEGSHMAVCDMFVDLGLQDSRFGAKHKIYLHWQIPALRIEFEKDGEKINAPMSIGATYTLSLADKSNLRPMLQSWRGRAFTADELKQFDVSSVLGAPCMITVTHNPKEGGSVYANVGAVVKIPAGIPVPQIEGEPVIYDKDNLASFETLRPWLKDKINNQIMPKEEPEPEERGGLKPGDEGHIPGFDSDLDDDIPF